jgi:hypothetical protein
MLSTSDIRFLLGMNFAGTRRAKYRRLESILFLAEGKVMQRVQRKKSNFVGGGISLFVHRRAALPPGSTRGSGFRSRRLRHDGDGPSRNGGRAALWADSFFETSGCAAPSEKKGHTPPGRQGQGANAALLRPI